MISIPATMTLFSLMQDFLSILLNNSQLLTNKRFQHYFIIHDNNNTTYISWIWREYDRRKPYYLYLWGVERKTVSERLSTIIKFKFGMNILISFMYVCITWFLYRQRLYHIIDNINRGRIRILNLMHTLNKPLCFYHWTNHYTCAKIFMGSKFNTYICFM